MTMDRERFSGCLIGQCLGDALGFPVEGFPPEACAIYVDDTMRVPDAERLARRPRPFGQYTDDSQLARELLQSYAAHGRFDPEDYARRIAAIFTEERIVGRGLATHRAALRLAAGVGWEEAGELPPAAGNGSAMRAGPVGLLFHDDRAQLLRTAHDQGRITHRDPRCAAGSVAIAGAVAIALDDAPVEVTRWARRLADDARPHDAGFADALLRLPEWVALPPDRAVTAIPHRLGQPDSPYHWEGVSPFVVSSVLWSLYAFLRTPDDYWETICTAIAVGGDVDTTAAMAGAISGARLGLARLPLDLARALTDQGTWRYDELVALAHECHGRKHPQPGPAAR
jgi:ADP-ribosylglycohydrolase